MDQAQTSAVVNGAVAAVYSVAMGLKKSNQTTPDKPWYARTEVWALIGAALQNILTPLFSHG